MSFRPEPILDIARGLTAFTAAYIVGNQILGFYKDLFIDRCADCKGAGRIICKHCGGTKTMRRRPAEFQRIHFDIVDRSPLDVYQCPHCGPPTLYDEMEDVEDDLDEAYNVMDNMKDAFAGRVRKHRMPVLAGTVPCPTCNNRPTVYRHTPNLEKLFKLENPWVLSIAAKEGKFGLPSPIRRGRYLEYPSREPHTDELDPEYLTESMKADYELSLRDQLMEKIYKEENKPPKWWGNKNEEDMKADVEKRKEAQNADMRFKYVDDSDTDLSEDEDDK